MAERPTPPKKAAPVKGQRRSGNPAVRAGKVERPAPPPTTKLTPTRATTPEARRAELRSLLTWWRHPPEELALPPDGAEYPQILRGPSYVWWHSVLGAITGLLLFVLLTTVISQAIITLVWSVADAGYSYRDFYTEAFAFKRPVGLLATNLGIAVLILISWGLMVAVHQVRPRWLNSVGPRLRWRYLFACLGVALVVLNAMNLLYTNLAGPALHIQPQPHFWSFLVVVVLTSPLQAAGEEIFFRGYLMQALGSLVAKPWFGVVVSSVIFALLHGAQNLPLFLDRLGFGLLAAALVWRTGGLEAGIAAHVINNVSAFIIAALTTSIAELRAVQQIGWVQAGFDVGGFALFAVLAYAVARLRRVRNKVDLASVTTDN